MLSFPAAAQDLRLLVGTYTEGTAAEGVYLYSFDTETAATKLLSMAPAGNPSFVIASPDGRRAYSVNEFNDGRQGVSTYGFDEAGLYRIGGVPFPQPTTAATSPSASPAAATSPSASPAATQEAAANSRPRFGADPCNLLLVGDALVSSNYTGGSVTAFALGEDGTVRGLSQTGLELEGAHMHCAALSPDGKYIFVADLGSDCIHRFERGEGAQPLGTHSVAWKHRGRKQFGPRHLIFSADGRFAYLLCELADKLVVFSYSDGVLKRLQTLTAYKGKGHGSADLHLTPDGRFLYTSHRLRGDGIAIFSVDPSRGKVRRAGFQPTGTHPRNFAISPDGRYLLCACRDSNRIEIYRIDAKTGALSPVDSSIELGAPVCVQFID